MCIINESTCCAHISSPCVFYRWLATSTNFRKSLLRSTFFPNNSTWDSGSGWLVPLRNGPNEHYDLQVTGQRHLLQAFLAGVDEASIVNGALELQHTSCSSTDTCSAGADCINGICTCQSTYVETNGQVSRPLVLSWYCLCPLALHISLDPQQSCSRVMLLQRQTSVLGYTKVARCLACVLPLE